METVTINKNIEIVFSKEQGDQADSRNKAKHRYYYKKSFNTDKPEKILTFIMLNPSNADEYKPDRTINKIEKIAKNACGYTSFAVVNLFSYRTAKPEELIKTIKNLSKQEKTGFNSTNEEYIKSKITGDIVLAWGAKAKSICNKYDKEMYSRILNMIKKSGINLYSLKLNDDNSPKHPARLSSTNLIKTGISDKNIIYEL